MGWTIVHHDVRDVVAVEICQSHRRGNRFAETQRGVKCEPAIARPQQNRNPAVEGRDRQVQFPIPVEVGRARLQYRTAAEKGVFTGAA
jgi:hypothetical protein